MMDVSDNPIGPGHSHIVAEWWSDLFRLFVSVSAPFHVLLMRRLPRASGYMLSSRNVEPQIERVCSISDLQLMSIPLLGVTLISDVS